MKASATRQTQCYDFGCLMKSNVPGRNTHIHEANLKKKKNTTNCIAFSRLHLYLGGSFKMNEGEVVYVSLQAAVVLVISLGVLFVSVLTAIVLV